MQYSVQVGSPYGLFIPGVTWPAYTPTVDFSGAKNVGNLPGVTRTNASVTTNGVTNVAAGTYNNLNYNDTVVNTTSGPVTFNNCRFYMSPTSDYIASDSIRGLARNVNGTCGLVTFNDCELHCRSQRVMNCFQGRNAVFNRCVLTGGVDGPSVSWTNTGLSNGTPSGSAPLNFGIHMSDTWVGEQAWWRSPSMPWEGHGSDKQTHNDGSQVGGDGGNEWHNCTIVVYASPYVGTGTPNAGSNTGNSYVPSSGTNYIRTQALQDADRATYLNYMTTASQAYLGISRPMSETGGALAPDATSWACIMGNRNNGIVDKVQFSGGSVSINLSDASSNFTGAGWSVKRCLFYNDMTLGHGADPTVKGVAIRVKTSAYANMDIPTTGADRNLWFDGTTVTPTLV
jgi:hypothetical protein